VSDLPFKEELINGFHVRVFSSIVEEGELKWHFDDEDRIVISEYETDWMFQMDNQIPFRIPQNEPIYIPEGEYHRIIKGSGDLTVKVKKINNK
jgi:hypothetical protein